MAHILLLAEPSLTIQRVVQLTFANEDIDVVVASDGAEAIEQAERLRPSVVLADVALARMTGYEVAAHFKRHPRFAGVPVVLLAGAFERVDATRAAECGCDLVLSKPFEPRHLLAHVKALLPGSPAGITPDDAARGSAARATQAGFVPVALSSGHATALEALPTPERQPAPAQPPVLATQVSAVPVTEPAPPSTPPEPVWPEPVVPETAHVVLPDPLDVPERPAERSVVQPAEPVAAAPVSPAALPPVLANWMQPEPVDVPKPGRRPVEPPPELEPVPSFEMLALTNKAMRLVPPPASAEEPEPETDADAYAYAGEPAQEFPQGNRGAGHDLGDLIPSLDDYFDQLDAAFASGGDTGFRRPPDAAQPPVAAPVPPALPRVVAPPPAPTAPPPAVREEPPVPPPSPVVAERRKTAPVPEPAEDRGPAVSPFSTLRLESPAPRTAPTSSATIDDAYDALMKQLQEPKQRPSVVALRADDELLVERAVERVLAQLDTAALREAMTDVVTNLTKKVIAEEIERIRRP